jgi:hypothetical protein
VTSTSPVSSAVCQEPSRKAIVGCQLVPGPQIELGEVVRRHHDVPRQPHLPLVRPERVVGNDQQQRRREAARDRDLLGNSELGAVLAQPAREQGQDLPCLLAPIVGPGQHGDGAGHLVRATAGRGHDRHAELRLLLAR